MTSSENINNVSNERNSNPAIFFCDEIKRLVGLYQELLSSDGYNYALSQQIESLSQSITHYHAFDSQKYRYLVTIPQDIKAQESIDTNIINTSPTQFIASEVRFCGPKDEYPFQIDFYNSDSNVWLSVFDTHFGIEPDFSSSNPNETVAYPADEV